MSDQPIPTPIYSTVSLPDGIVIGGKWPGTIITWPGGNARGATKPEYDLWQALEQLQSERDELRQALIQIQTGPHYEKVRQICNEALNHSNHTTQ